MAAAISDRAEVDTARPFRSVREAVAVFGDRILVGESQSRSCSAGSFAVATPIANTSASAIATLAEKHEASSRSSTITLSPNPMAESEAEAEAMPAVVPMYSASSSPQSLASSPSPNKMRCDDGADEAGFRTVRSIEKLETEGAETRQEVAQLRKRSTEMEMAVASLNAQLHRGLSKLAEMEADKAAAAARRSIGGDTDVTPTVRSERYWGGEKLVGSEYLPSFSHALSLGEFDDDDDLICGGGRRKVQKVKPIVPLIGDILFSKRKNTKEKGDGLYSGDL